MSATLTNLTDFESLFDELWLALGPKERGDYAEKMAVYHKALRDIRAASLRAAIERCIQQSRMRALPAPGEIRARALEHHLEMQSAMRNVRDDRPPVPHTHCECRCGGKRWHRVLRDQTTNAVRCYPADIVARTEETFSDDQDARALPDSFRRTIAALAGEPMLRTHVHCKKHLGAQVDREPPMSSYLGLGDDGCPVYDPDRRVALEVAA